MQNFEKPVFEKRRNVQSAEELGPMTHAIMACIASAFQGGVTEQDSLEHMHGDLVLVHKDAENDRVNSFGAFKFGSPNEIFGRMDLSDEQGIYIAAVTVHQEAQGNGLYKAMNVEGLSEAVSQRYPVVFTRTQNPRVQAGVQSILHEFVQEKKIAGYTLEQRLLPGFYGQMLTKEQQFARSVTFDELDAQAGDAYILIFNLRYEKKEV